MRIAVVDDQDCDRVRMKQYLDRFQEEENIKLIVDVWDSSLEFIERYHNQYEIILLDIEMPGLDGMDVARELRKIDEYVGIIFITNMAQYAIQGYEVNAVDFLVKPVKYENFLDKMHKAIKYIRKRQEKTLILENENSILRIDLSEIWYIEKNKNYLLFHTEQGVLQRKGTMKEMKEKLLQYSFAECNSGCLINVNYVDKINKDTVYVRNQILPLSRRMKKQFVQKVMDYLGGFA